MTESKLFFSKAKVHVRANVLRLIGCGVMAVAGIFLCVVFGLEAYNSSAKFTVANSSVSPIDCELCICDKIYSLKKLAPGETTTIWIEKVGFGRSVFRAKQSSGKIITKELGRDGLDAPTRLAIKVGSSDINVSYDGSR